ncbi:MAG TPA: hypothetical protein VF635_05310 [Propionibacteriaceae bacterium]
MSTIHNASHSGSQRKPGRLLRHSLRWPLAATFLALSLVLAGFILDASPGMGRDLALILGGPALTVLLPASVTWLIVASVMHYRRHKATEAK